MKFDQGLIVISQGLSQNRKSCIRCMYEYFSSNHAQT